MFLRQKMGVNYWCVQEWGKEQRSVKNQGVSFSCSNQGGSKGTAGQLNIKTTGNCTVLGGFRKMVPKQLWMTTNGNDVIKTRVWNWKPVLDGGESWWLRVPHEGWSVSPGGQPRTCVLGTQCSEHLRTWGGKREEQKSFSFPLFPAFSVPPAFCSLSLPTE